MKILLAAVNAKYIHSNLAVYSLAAYAGERYRKERKDRTPVIEIAEYTINQPLDKILMDIYSRRPDVIFFSCYIWNRTEISRLAEDASSIMPGTDIWIGGPEVSFDPEETLRSLPSVKGIVCGEGEEIFYSLTGLYSEGRTGDSELGRIKGLVFRDENGDPVSTGLHVNMKLSDVPFPYDSLEEFENRIIYYESSRGCPFRCSYCLSALEKTLRFRDMDLVKEELEFFISRRVRQVKFIDRTFNCSHRHAMDIWEYIKANDNGVTNFHFEIAGDILRDDEIELLNSLRPGQVQLEIGVQTTNEKTLEEINRTTDMQRLREVTAKLRAPGNIHLYLDLIAGLPYEDYESFASSFNDVFSMEPHELQLGFLKVLKGSPISERSSLYGLKYTSAPPYEVLSTEWISYDDLIRLKDIEEMVETYYNSGQFVNSARMLLGYFDSPFDMFSKLAEWHSSHGMRMLNLSRNHKYEYMLRFAGEHVPADEMEKFTDALIYDYYLRENVKSRPGFFGNDMVERSYSKEFYSRESREHRYLSGGRCDTDDPRLLRRLTHIEKKDGRYYLFDYTRRDPVNNNVRVVEIVDD